MNDDVKVLIHEEAGDSERPACAQFAELITLSNFSAWLHGLGGAHRHYIYCRHCGFFRWMR